MSWVPVLVAAGACYLLKVAGFAVPARVLDRSVVRRVSALLPVAVLAALVAVQTVVTGTAVALDARLAGLAAALVALLLRAPFLVVVVVGAAAAALVRAAGWMP